MPGLAMPMPVRSSNGLSVGTARQFSTATLNPALGLADDLDHASELVGVKSVPPFPAFPPAKKPGNRYFEPGFPGFASAFPNAGSDRSGAGRVGWCSVDAFGFAHIHYLLCVKIALFSKAGVVFGLGFGFGSKYYVVNDFNL